MQSRKLIYYVAMSLDGFIMREDGSPEGFLAEGRYIADFLFSLNQFDTVLMGRRTYEWGFAHGATPGEPAPYPNPMMNYVFSKSLPDYRHERLRVIREDAPTFVRRLKGQQGGAIWLCGGGDLAGSLIDELIVKLNSVLFGKGVALFGKSPGEAGLTFLDSKTYTDGLLMLHYAIR
jgi:dihydrofolate reductase